MINEKVGDYHITNALGKGGFGSVWMAKSSDGATVALKLLNPQALDNQKVVKKFFHEAMILAKLNHPNITKLLEFFPDGDNYAIVMEYVEGIELKKQLQQQKGRMPFNQAYKIALQSLDAFQYAHEHGILHRDIKPANIMIDKNGNAKIMDFGIAKMGTTASHDTAASMLSVHYTPPERFDKSREIDQRSDIYSLGLVFYEMFAGRRAFSATETSQIMFSHLNEIPEPPSKHAPNLPPQICKAISKALEKDPEDRFPGFKAFKQAIQLEQTEIDGVTSLVSADAAMTDATIDVDALEMPLLKTTEAPATEEKKKPASVLAGIIAFVLIAGGVGGYFLFNQAPSETERATIETPAPTPAPAETKTAAAPAAVPGPGREISKGFNEVKNQKDGSIMIAIPAGEFTMGSDKYSAERPVQKINLDSYYIDKYLITNKQFAKFADESKYRTDAEKEGSGNVRIGRRWKKVEGASWKKPDGLTTIDGRENHPVSQVSYNDASAYCNWAQKDLPTEAQWEKAARGPDGNEYPWGNSDPNDTSANFDNIVGKTTPVGEYEKGQSFYGVQDMAGNVYQWCRDWYGIGERAAANPAGPKEGKERVIKGGSFIEGMESLRSANRDRYEPNYSSFLFGFRCAGANPKIVK